MSRLSLAILSTFGTLGLAYACIDTDSGGDKSLEIGDVGLISGLGVSYQGELEMEFGKMPQQAHDQSPAQRHDMLAAVTGLLEAELRKGDTVSEADRTATVAWAMQALFAKETPWKHWPKEVQSKLEHVPAEFMIYIRSLDEDRVVALAETTKLLTLPESERRNLTALAHYRKGRLLTLLADWEKLTDAEAKARIREIRSSYQAALDAIEAGAPDVARLSAAAEGWIAHSKALILPYERLSNLGEADAAGALRIYLDLRRRGESMGESSAYLLIRKLSGHCGWHAEFAKDDNLRTLITIYLCSGGNRRIGDENWGEEHSVPVTSWISALETVPDKAGKDAARIALLLYNTGKYDQCAQVLEQCPPDDTTAALLRSRLALRQGKRSEAAKALHRAVEKLPPISAAPAWGSNWYFPPAENRALMYIDRSQIRSLGGKARAELALLRHSEGSYAEALGLYLLSGQEWSATYIAECVMSIEELKAVVDRELMAQRPIERSWGEPHDLNATIRQLLGRRLCRAGRWSEALPYLGEKAREKAMQHIRLMSIAADTSLPNRLRADAYWKSGRIMFDEGNLLLHCPFGESHSSGSGWSMGEWPLCRIQPTEENPLQRIAAPSDDETRRVRQWWDANLAKPNRAHRLAKYEGLRLTLLAASLLPDNDPAGGTIVHYAGQTLMYLDPPAANAAYKVLATRFKETPEGKYAFSQRWFMPRQKDGQLPPLEDITSPDMPSPSSPEKAEGR